MTVWINSTPFKSLADLEEGSKTNAYIYGEWLSNVALFYLLLLL